VYNILLISVLTKVTNVNELKKIKSSLQIVI